MLRTGTLLTIMAAAGAGVATDARAQAPGRGRQLKGHANFITALAFAKGGKLLASASSDGTVRVWDVDGGKSLHTLKLPEGELAAGIAFSPDGKYVVAAFDKQAVAWDAGTGAERWRRDIAGTARAVAVSPDGGLVAVAAKDVHVLSGQTGEEGQKLAAKDVNALAFAPEGSYLAAGGAGGVQMWDRRIGKADKEIASGYTAASLSFSADGKRLAVGGEDSQVRVYDVESAAELWSKPELASGTNVIAIGKIVLGGVGEKKLMAWDLAKGNDSWWVIGSGPELHVLAAARDGRRIATGGPGGSIVLWGN